METFRLKNKFFKKTGKAKSCLLEYKACTSIRH